MGYYFPVILLSLTVFCGIVYVFWLFVPKAKREELKSTPGFKVMHFIKDFFWVLLFVFVLRSFIGSLYTVPTGSLEPTVIPGDILLTTKYNYGLRSPIWEHQFVKTGSPKRGDIIVFNNPVHPKTNLIKRLIGLPGDHISYINKVLYINGKKMTQTYIGDALDYEANNQEIPVKKYQENLDGVKHNIIRNPQYPAQNFYNLVVPQGHYFFMGDNRDGSDDSRYWGFASDKDLVGKAHFVLTNFSHFKRSGTKLYNSK